MDKVREAMETPRTGGSSKRKGSARDHAAEKVASLRGGSGRADSLIDEDFSLPPRQKVIENPLFNRFSKLQ